MSHEELCSLVDFKFHHGAIAIADMPKLAPFDIAQVLAPLNKKESLDPALKKCSFFLCLWDVTDPSNVGALVRTAAGLGVDGVLVGPGCANPFYRKAIRASMGNAFTLPLWSVDVHGLEKLTQNGALLIAAALDENSMAIDRVNSKDTLLKAVASPQNALIILVLGNEGYGLPPEVLALSAIHVRIPMERGVDSLNVAVAGGILMYEIIRAKG
jgi:tRNA G18 (ribose-2'-O)-methylase SpoU